MLQHFYMSTEETAIIMLFGIGFAVLLLRRNLIKKIMGMNIMDTVVYLFLVAKGCIERRMMPIMINRSQDPMDYISPIPSGFVLTDTVVPVNVMALMLALTTRLYQRYGSLDLGKIIIEAQKGEP